MAFKRPGPTLEWSIFAILTIAALVALYIYREMLFYHSHLGGLF
ncbi:MAG: hypothetical protein P4L53_28040 [Candidatus Obscuribacterales bacterium]|nr:hypothetical protein [Candidatus Obscuribacterales bacterium]